MNERPPDAYLVVHRGARWTDVYRLSSTQDGLSQPSETIIGRSSGNQIVLRSGRASRRHARIFPEFASGDVPTAPTSSPAAPAISDSQSPKWVIEDLSSRNGVLVNGDRLTASHRLVEGDLIEIAGFQLRFASDLATLSPQTNPVVPTTEDQATEDDLGDPWEIENSHELVSQRMSSELLVPTNIGTNAPYAPAASTGTTEIHQGLLQLAFSLGRAEETDEAAESLLQGLKLFAPDSDIGLYLLPVASASQSSSSTNTAGDEKRTDQQFGNDPHELPLPLHVRQRDGHRYRRPPRSLVTQILAPNSPAVLARNVLGDRSLATENTQGEIDVESIILVPLHEPAPAREYGGQPIGLIHVTTGQGDRPLDDQDLHWIVTAGEIFSAAVAGLQKQQRLQHNLDHSQRTIASLRSQLDGRIKILGRSEPIQIIQQQIVQVSPTNAAVLIRGESGVGKELVASAIHHASPRRDAPIVCLNCAALSKDLLESELFGHERGAFTGATEQKRGKFEAASGGTLMLDEIGEMSLDLQAKLLRVLEGHPFERVGGHEPIEVDVRVIAATHRDLRAMAAEGTFRQDLFYRLHVVEILVPPLRERGRDIVLLARKFLQSFTQAMGRPPTQFTGAAEKKLLAYSWPGNVRELGNAIERAVVLAPQFPSPQSPSPQSPSPQSPISNEDGSKPTAVQTTFIDADDLLLNVTNTATKSSQKSNSIAETDHSLSLADLERQHIERVLKSTGGNKSRASTILGIERSTLDRKLKRYAE